MFRSIRTFLVAIAAACAIPTAFAEDSVARPVYLALDAGQSNATSACNGIPAGFSCGTTATAFRGIVGYRFAPSWAVELHYTDFGTINVNGYYLGFPISGSFKASGEEAAFVAIVPLNGTLDFNARLGVATTKATTSASAAGYTLSATSNTTTAVPGVGLRFHFTDMLAAQINYDYYGTVGNSNTTGSSKLSTISAGLTLSF